MTVVTRWQYKGRDITSRGAAAHPTSCKDRIVAEEVLPLEDFTMLSLPRRLTQPLCPSIAVPALILAWACSTASAVLNDNTVRGAATNHVFSSALGDSVDALSGQLTFQIPIGPAEVVSPSLSYQLSLNYSSKVWRYLGSPWYHSTLESRGQAGVGFTLELGHVLWQWSVPVCDSIGDDTRVLVLHLGDGTERELTKNMTQTTGSTDDMSFIRFLRLGANSSNDPNHPVLGYRLTMPDGTTYLMDHWVPDRTIDPNNSSCTSGGRPHNPADNDSRGWYVTRIEDTSGHFVTVSYDTQAGMEHLIRQIVDSTGRTIVFDNVPPAPDPGIDPNTGLAAPNSRNLGFVAAIRTPSFGQPTGAVGDAVYRFTYEVATTVDDLVRYSGGTHPHTTTMPGEVFLKRLDLPGGLAFQFDYSAYDAPHNHTGAISTKTLPTGAQVRYQYARYSHSISVPFYNPTIGCNVICSEVTNVLRFIDGSYVPQISCVGPDPNCANRRNQSDDLPGTFGVALKMIRSNPDSSVPFSESLQVQEAVWLWDRSDDSDDNGMVLSNPKKVIQTDPDGNWTITYFRASGGPITDPVLLNTDPTQRFNWPDGLPTRTEYWSGSKNVLLRAITKEYEDDADDVHLVYGPIHSQKNRRVKITAITDFEGGVDSRRVVNSDWDGLGHYRRQDEYNLDGSKYRTKLAGYNCDTTDANGLCPRFDETVETWPPTLNRYAFQELLDGVGTLVSQSEFTFGSDGKMRSQVDRGAPVSPRRGAALGTVDPIDVVTQLYYYGDAGCTGVCPAEPDPSHPSTGNLAFKRVEGGDPNAQRFEESYTYSAGAFLSKRQIVGLPWKALDQDVDTVTGLVATSRDTASVPTSYIYDSLGRLVRVTHATSGEAPIGLTYNNIFTTTVVQQSAVDPSNQLRQVSHFDQLFRVVAEDRAMDDGRVVTKHHAYDTLGRKTFESEWGSSVLGTQLEYSLPTPPGATPITDPLGRVHKKTSADGSVVETEYHGLSTIVTTRGLGEDPNARFDSTTTYERDAFGRLIGVVPPRRQNPLATEPSALGAQAQYDYDVRDNLVGVQLVDTADPNATPQRRFFEHDSLNRLVRSTTPELGTVAVLGFNSVGDATTTEDSSGKRFQYVYDPARRLLSKTLVQAQPLTLAQYIYDEYPGQPRGASGGKLVHVVSRSTSGMTFQKGMYYYGVGGRLSRVDSLFSDLGAMVSVGYEYNDVGLVQSTSYPANPYESHAATVVQSTYRGGYLVEETAGPGAPFGETFTYNDAGGLRRYVTQRGVVTEITPDAMHRPGQIRVIGIADPNGGGGPGGGGHDCGENCMPGKEEYSELFPLTPSDQRLIGQSNAPPVLYDSGIYRYDSMGNVVGVGPDLYRYDPIGRLIYARQNGDLAYHESVFSYDAYGNLKKLVHDLTSTSGTTTIERDLSLDGVTNRVKAEVTTGLAAPSVDPNWHYDDNGNVIGDGQNQYFYDPLNRLMRVESGGRTISDYEYDDGGFRILKKDRLGDLQIFYVRDENGRLMSEFQRRLSVPSDAAIWERDHLYAGERLVGMIQNQAPPPPRDVDIDVRPNTSAPTAAPGIDLTVRQPADFDVTAYLVEKTYSTGTTETLTLNVSGPYPLILHDSTVSSGQTYSYRVRALDSAANEGLATPPLVATPGDTTRPGPPKRPNLAPGDGMVDVRLVLSSTSHPADYRGWQVYRRRSDEPAFTRVTSKPLVAPNYTDSGLTNRMVYEYFTTAVDTSGLESWSSGMTVDPNWIRQAIPADLVPPGAPRGVVANVSSNSVNLWWAPSPEPDLAFYRVYSCACEIEDDPNAAIHSPVEVGGATQPNAAYLGLVPNTDHAYRIAAVDLDGNVSWLSEEVRVKTLSGLGQVPTLREMHVSSCTDAGDESTQDPDVCPSPGDFYFQTGFLNPVTVL
ncbi:MAG: hypothetical protein HY049_14980 [Acidobacteria bacterium]|nr:hypothetical protein [Acidobacteriota bacterium]